MARILFILFSMSFMAMFHVKDKNQEQWVAPHDFANMKNPFTNSIDEDNTGKRLFIKHCKGCHGEKGMGDGRKAELLDLEMVNFNDGIIDNQSDGSLFYKINEGRSLMPGFKQLIPNDKEKWLLINYLRTLVKE